MKSLFDIPTAEQLKLIETRNKLIDQQDALKIHHYRTKDTVLTDDDKKHAELQAQIDEINNQL